AVDDSGNPVLDAAGAGAHAVPYRLRHRGVPWLVGAVEVAATRRQRHALGRSATPAWFADAAGRALDGAGGLARSGVPLVAGAHRGVADPLGTGLGAYQSHGAWAGGVPAQAVPDPRGIQPARRTVRHGPLQPAEPGQRAAAGVHRRDGGSVVQRAGL